MKTKITWFDRMMAAATFAEANEQGTARELLTGSGRNSKNRHHCKESDACYAADLNGAKANS
jgi:hypothetical protein